MMRYSYYETAVTAGIYVLGEFKNDTTV